VLKESPQNSGRYAWSLNDAPDGRWVSGFEAFNADGTVLVEICQYNSTAGMLTGKAQVKADENGFHIVRWKEAPR
jgi:hypothetical protein